MKILSLNVNRFSGMENRNYTATFDMLEQCPKANEIVDAAERHLASEPENIVILQEKRGLTCTLAIARKDRGRRKAACTFVRDYQHKYVIAGHNALSVLGIHAVIIVGTDTKEDFT